MPLTAFLSLPGECSFPTLLPRPVRQPVRAKHSLIRATALSCSKPPPDPLHRLVHLGSRAGIAEPDKVPAVDWIEIDAGRRGDMGLLEHPLGEVEAVEGEA